MSENNSEKQQLLNTQAPSNTQSALFPFIFGSAKPSPPAQTFSQVDADNLAATFNKLQLQLDNDQEKQSASKNQLTTNPQNNDTDDKEPRPIAKIKRKKTTIPSTKIPPTTIPPTTIPSTTIPSSTPLFSAPSSLIPPPPHQKPLQQQLAVCSLPSFSFSPQEAETSSPLTGQQSKEKQLSVHTLPSFDFTPEETSPSPSIPEETISNGSAVNSADETPLDMKEALATCFKFASQSQHSLATTFYYLDSLRPSTEWHQITVLSLGRQHLLQLDHLDKHFPFLEQLDVSHNELKTLSHLPPSLIYLYACDNKLSELNISQLDKLQHLDISHNNISALDDLSRLKSLRVIDASHNSITSCKYFNNLPGLTKLSLRNNTIRRLAGFESVARGNQLETLDISFNRIECLDSIENLTELRNLNAEHNDIKYMQLTQPLERLFKLQLGFNRLKSFDVSLFPDIRTLYLDDNAIQRIIGVACVPRIESFSLRDQGGNKVEYNLQYLRGARKLYLSGSPFHNMERLVDFYSLEYLELCAASIDTLPAEFSKHAPNLSTLYLSLNRLSDIRPLRKLKYLKRLVLIENRLISVNEVIAVVQHLKQLNYLDLRQNPISTNIYPSLNLNLIQSGEKIKISPYVSSALDESWEAQDQVFRTGLSPQWLTRRKVYRALITQKCAKLVELDHIPISQQDRLESDPIIDSYRKASISTSSHL